VNTKPTSKVLQPWHLLILLASLSLACMITNVSVNLLQSGSIIFEDDFSHEYSGWDRITTDSYSMDYKNNVYRIFVSEPNIDVWSTPNFIFEDTIIEVDATKAGGPDNNNFGVICRKEKQFPSYYFFIISSDGYYAIGKYINGEQKLLNSNVMQPSNIIHQGYTANHLRVECVKQRLSLSVNGVKLAEVSDNSLTKGEAGLLAGSFDMGGVDIYFDNFIVIKP